MVLRGLLQMNRILTQESLLKAIKNRFLQSIARNFPGSTTIRIWLHKLRGVKIGKDVFIGTDVLLDTAHPEKIVIGDRVIIGIRSTLIAHFDNLGEKHLASRKPSLVIGDEVFIGPGVIIMPNIKIGKGAVVAAGSVVTKSVPPHTMVQGNPAAAVATCGKSLTRDTNMWDFYRQLKTVKRKR
ncbi:MAG: acyltransferase [Spirochaetales bacterium]|nr:acyltransferase [Spirochaetales bacterium]